MQAETVAAGLANNLQIPCNIIATYDSKKRSWFCVSSVDRTAKKCTFARYNSSDGGEHSAICMRANRVCRFTTTPEGFFCHQNLVTSARGPHTLVWTPDFLFVFSRLSRYRSNITGSVRTVCGTPAITALKSARSVDQ